MAAKKSIRKKPGSHHRRADNRQGARAAGRRVRGTGSPTEVCTDCEPAATLAQRLSEPDDVVELLSNRLTLVETAALALREFESHPGVGSICTALEQSVDLLGRAHAAVNLYLQRKRS